MPTSSELALRTEGLGKLYRLGARRRGYRTLREQIIDSATAPLRRLRALLRGHSAMLTAETLWALRDLSLEVRRGEVVGIVGRNGAGKTTLLKILSRITEPTSGRATIHGRVASLLEVGTGFHPELTGRENIFLNGAILGMKRVEIATKFDEIVGFAEVERFIDTQVKHYSSGMYLRLAFAVAAHLEPEILLVDEVLAVGDVSFQRKCLGKMGDVAGAGRTILFVSHNLEAMLRLCQRCVWLDGGRLVRDGDSQNVIAAYLRACDREQGAAYARGAADDDDDATLLHAELLAANGQASDHLHFGEPFAIRMLWQHRAAAIGAAYFVRVYDRRERLIFAANTSHSDVTVNGEGRSWVECRLEANVLVPGEYHVTLGCFSPPKRMHHLVERGLRLSVLSVPHPGVVLPQLHQDAIVAPQLVWHQQMTAPNAAG